jgi:hypothetical protein
MKKLIKYTPLIAMLTIGLYVYLVRPDINSPPTLIGFFGLVAVNVCLVSYRLIKKFMTGYKKEHRYTLSAVISIVVVYLLAVMSLGGNIFGELLVVSVFLGLVFAITAR